MRNNDVFDGTIEIEVQGQEVATKAQRRLIAESFGDGHDVPGEVRFACRIAMDVNAAIADGVEFENGKTYVPNPRARAQFGKNKNGLPYLTFGLVDAESGERYTLCWEGVAVPLPMVKSAIAHDEGRNVKPAVIELPFNNAKVRPAKNTRAESIARGWKVRQRNDVDENGELYPRPERRQHGRLCRSDLETIQALRRRAN